MAPKKKQPWVRTGGAQGDESMSKIDAFHASGCGVDDSVEDVGAEPNKKFIERKVRKDRMS